MPRCPRHRDTWVPDRLAALAVRDDTRCLSRSLLPFPWIPIAAGRGRLNHDRFAGVDDGGVAALQPFHAAVLPAHGILADLTRLAAGQAERAHAAASRENRAFHFFEEADGAADAVAGFPFAAPARTLADVKILEQHRIAELEHLRIGEARVGHVRVDGIGAVEAGSGRRAGADRLVILMARIAEVEIVHRALRGG